MDSAEWRERVGRHVERRRIELYESRRAAAAASGLSETLWRQIESGERNVAAGVKVPVSPGEITKSKIAKALRWPGDAFDRLLAGENWRALTQEERRDFIRRAGGELQIDPPGPTAQPGAHSGLFADATPEELAALEEIYRIMRRDRSAE